MASYNGILYPSIELPEDAANGQSTTSPDLVNPYVVGVSSPGNPVVVPTNHAGDSHKGTAREVIFEQIYFSPTEIDLGFIGDDSVHNVYIWNAFLTEEKNLTQLQVVNIAGTSHNVPTPPVIIRPNTEKQYQITVSKSGNAVQSTQYLFTIGSDLFVIVVNGKRITAFPFEGDWVDLKTSYRFNTVISRNKRFTEQRRPLLNLPMRKISLSFMFEKLDQEIFFNLVKQYMLKTLGIPLYSEPITPTSNLQGVTTIPVSESLAHYFNLQYATLVLIKSISSFMSEIKEIASLGANSITVTSAVIENFTASDTVIFPVFIGIIEAEPQVELLTDTMIKTSLVLKEVVV